MITSSSRLLRAGLSQSQLLRPLHCSAVVRKAKGATLVMNHNTPTRVHSEMLRFSVNLWGYTWFITLAGAWCVVLPRIALCAGGKGRSFRGVSVGMGK